MNAELHLKTLNSAAAFKKAEGDLIEKLLETDRTKNFAYYGMPSLFRYCTDLLKLSESDTSRFIQVTRKSKEVPALKKAISEGVLTVSKASRIASVITPSNQLEWIEKAATLKQRELEREVAKENPKAVLKRETLRVLTEALSAFSTTFAKEEVEKIKRAQEVLKTKSLKEALLSSVDFTLKHKDPVEKAKRRIEHPSREVKPQAFDTESPYIPASIRHVVVQRDQGKCREKGCDSKHWVEIHHIIPITQGGKHELSNLITLCSMHHDLKHNFQKQSYKSSSPRINLNKSLNQQTDIRSSKHHWSLAAS